MNTRVEFHTGVVEPLRFACRLLRKAYRQGATLVVSAPADTLTALDRELWVFEAQEFVPHRRLRSGQTVDATMRRTPIWLVESEPPAPCPPILVNLGSAGRIEPGRWARVIEIVSTEPEDIRLARSRWRDYESRGISVEHHAASPRADT